MNLSLTKLSPFSSTTLIFTIDFFLVMWSIKLLWRWRVTIRELNHCRIAGNFECFSFFVSLIFANRPWHTNRCHTFRQNSRFIFTVRAKTVKNTKNLAARKLPTIVVILEWKDESNHCTLSLKLIPEPGKHAIQWRLYRDYNSIEVTMSLVRWLVETHCQGIYSIVNLFHNSQRVITSGIYMKGQTLGVTRNKVMTIFVEGDMVVLTAG